MSVRASVAENDLVESDSENLPPPLYIPCEIVVLDPDLLDLDDPLEQDTTEHQTETGIGLGDEVLGSTNSRTPLNYTNDATFKFSLPMPRALAAGRGLDAPSCVNIPSIEELNVQDFSDSIQSKL
jgi:hypothetical protein